MRAPNTRTIWTPEDFAVLEQMMADGEGYVAIGAALGRTPLAIRCMLRDLRRRGTVIQSGAPSEHYRALAPNNDAKHLRRIARANKGRGFPFYTFSTARAA